jgi:hypothetical protein
MRQLITAKIIEMLLNSNHYGKYISGYGSYTATRHKEIVSSLERANDSILLSIYTWMISGNELIPCSVDQDGKYADVKIGHLYGGMDDQGNIHT